jgi:hypothetical protein
VQLFGIERLREPREPAEIGKQHGHGSPFEGKGMTAALDATRAEMLNGQSASVILGIRPEAIQVRESGTGGTACTVYMEEPLGVDSLRKFHCPPFLGSISIPTKPGE